MELRQLAYFLAIAEERNFTRAAQRIPIAQPAISQQIHRLEAELSETLFVRDRRGVRLTPAGEALLPHAQAMLASAGHARDAVAAVSGVLAGRLAVGFVQPLPDHRFTALLGAFHREHPGIELRLIEDETDALLAGSRPASSTRCLSAWAATTACRPASCPGSSPGNRPWPPSPRRIRWPDGAPSRWARCGTRRWWRSPPPAGSAATSKPPAGPPGSPRRSSRRPGI